MAYPDGVLGNNRTSIKFCCYIVACGSNNLDAAFIGAVDGLAPGNAGKKEW